MAFLSSQCSNRSSRTSVRLLNVVWLSSSFYVETAFKQSNVFTFKSIAQQTMKTQKNHQKRKTQSLTEIKFPTQPESFQQSIKGGLYTLVNMTSWPIIGTSVKQQPIPLRNQKFVPSDVTNFGMRQSTKSWISGVSNIRYVDSFKLNWTNGKRRSTLSPNFKGSESGEKSAGRRCSVVGLSKSFAGKGRPRTEIYSEGGIEVSGRKKLGRNKWNSLSEKSSVRSRDRRDRSKDRSSNFDKFHVEDAVLRKIQTSENHDSGTYPNLVNLIIKRGVI